MIIRVKKKNLFTLLLTLMAALLHVHGDEVAHVHRVLDEAYLMVGAAAAHEFYGTGRDDALDDALLEVDGFHLEEWNLC